MNSESGAEVTSAKKTKAGGARLGVNEETSEVIAVDEGAANLAAFSTQEVITKYGKSATDTGSPEAQVALITRRLQILSSHFQRNTQDRHSRRGMMSLISARKGLLKYLRERDVGRYRTLIGSLGLRK